MTRRACVRSRLVCDCVCCVCSRGRRRQASEALDKYGKMNEMLPEMLVGIMLEMVTGSPTTPKGGLGELLAAYEATQAAEVAEGSASTDAAGAQLAAQQKDASMLVQKAAGTRFARMMQAAFENFGIGNVVETTTWPELFPDDPPLALAAFYGEQVVYELHSVCADASLTGVSFAKAAPRPKRGLSAP